MPLSVVVPPKLVFQRLPARVLTLALYIALSIGAAFIAFGVLDGPFVKRAIVVVGGLIAVVFFVPAALRQLRSPTPTLRLDHEGIEGYFGLVKWADVDRAVISHRVGRWPSVVRVVRLELRAGAPAPRTPSAEYASVDVVGSTRVTASTIEIPLWGSRRSVTEDLEQYAPRLLLS
jgi:hypothetical protein